MTHSLPIRIYYEDTDMAGIVYYANYLKFIERGRSLMVQGAGINQLEMQAIGLTFAVKRVEADYLASAKLMDELCVTTRVSDISGAKVVFSQEVVKADKVLFSAIVTVVCLKDGGKITRFPADIRSKLAQSG